MHLQHQKIPVRVLFAASEYAPLVKTGGLADVCAALPRALASAGVDVRVLLPGYPAVQHGIHRKRALATLAATDGFPEARLLLGEAHAGLQVYLLDCPSFYSRGGGPYQDASRHDWPDNVLRFGLLARAAAAIARGLAQRAWRPSVLHCHDWQSALAAAYLRFGPPPRVPSVLTVHNLAFQGLFAREWLEPLGLPAESFAIEGLEFHGRISFLKAGLMYADWITTVSPSYSREIQEERHGCGLAGVLRKRSDSLSGILNGIDTEEWDPQSDPWLERRYGADALEDKVVNKRALQRELGLPQEDIALFGTIARLTGQKGIDLIADIAPRMARLPAQLVVLGSGEAALERRLAELAQAHRGRIAVRFGFEERLAHRIEAGADSFLMPSRFEPCGMNQLYSQRYGTPPVVRATGGLADSVVDCTTQSLADATASGFVFEALDAESFFAAVERAARAWRDPALWQALQRNGMSRDFGWTSSAAQYMELYERLSRALSPAGAR
jgi:starch synthase